GMDAKAQITIAVPAGHAQSKNRTAARPPKIVIEVTVTDLSEEQRARFGADIDHLHGGEFFEHDPRRQSRAPLAVSRKTFSAPAARNCFTCASRLWPSVDTLA